MNYRDLELQLSRESPNHYYAKFLDRGNAAAMQTFELCTGELRVIESLQRLEKNAISSSKEEAFNKTFEEIRRKNDT